MICYHLTISYDLNVHASCNIICNLIYLMLHATDISHCLSPIAPHYMSMQTTMYSLGTKLQEAKFGSVYTAFRVTFEPPSEQFVEGRLIKTTAVVTIKIISKDMLRRMSVNSPENPLRVSE